MAEPPTVHTVKEAAELLGMSRATLYRLIRKHRVPHRVMPTGVIRFTEADIAEILDEAHRPAVA